VALNLIFNSEIQNPLNWIEVGIKEPETLSPTKTKIQLNSLVFKAVKLQSQQIFAHKIVASISRVYIYTPYMLKSTSTP
jgi:hypothetical protein